jgi:phage baseplate assembly protein V
MSGVATLPRLSLQLDGKEQPLELLRVLGEVRVQQRLSLPTLCELTFFEPLTDIEREPLATPGMALELRVEGFTEALFTGEVVAIEGEYEGGRGELLRLRAYDRLYRLRRRQPLRVHKQVTCAELARDLLADLGVQVDAREQGPVWRHLVQHDQTDFDLLAEVAARSGVYFTLRGSELVILSLAPADAELKLVLGRSLLEARIEINADPASQSVRTLAWDPWSAAAREGGSKDARARSKDAALDPGLGADARTLTGNAAETDEEATVLAQRELDRRACSERVLWGVADGNPALRPGAQLDIRGVARPFRGQYVATNTTHVIDRERGYQTEIDTLPPILPARRGAVPASLGVVTDVDDPEAVGRIRVELPAYGGLETEWLEVLLPAAGKQKGLVALPDVGDRVLVVFVGDDPSQAVVIGGLYGTQDPPDTGVSEGRVMRYTMATPGGQRMQLSDTDNAVRLETKKNSDLRLSPGRARIQNGSGSYVELKGKEVAVHAAEHLVLEAPGGQVIIRGANIDFEQG